MTYYVYILASRKRGTLYVGVTNDIARRTYEHRQGVADGFTKQHRVSKLVHVEPYDDPRTAIQREKNLKHWLRDWKIELIEKANPDWRDLFDDLNC